MRESATIRVTIDRQSLNRHLGNTPNATLEAGLCELLENIFGEFPYYCERCGTAYREPTGIIGTFTIEPLTE